MRVIYFLISEANSQIIEAAGVVDAVISTMRAHVAEPIIQSTGQAILDALLKAHAMVENPNIHILRSPRNRRTAGESTPSVQQRLIRSRSPCGRQESLPAVTRQ